MATMYDSDLHTRMYSRWLEHNHQPQTGTGVVTFDLLRATYPNFHVTYTDTIYCDLFGFAAAGHATATPQDSPLTHAVRFYKSPAYRLAKDPGKITDRVSFGCWLYQWNGTEYLVYLFEYPDFMGRNHKLCYVLHPDNPGKRTNDATDALLLESGKWTRELHEEIFIFDDGSWRKSSELYTSVQGASWDDVILKPEMKTRLVEDVQNFFDHQTLYQGMKVPWKRGVILHGAPGNGKTISIKALVNSLAARKESIPSLYVKSLDTMCGTPKWAIQQIFSKARVMAPCLLIFEDLDSMVTNKTRSYFLNEVDGLESNEGILMIGSTNHLNRLDSAITKRPSRFDRKYHFDLPDEEMRAAYASYWSRKYTDSTTVGFPDALAPLIAKMTDGFSFAYLQELFVSTLLTLARGTYDEPEEPESDKVSTAGSEAVLVGGDDGNAPKADEDPLPAGEEKPKKAGKKPVPPKAKKVVPEVEIPETLRNNVFLRIVKKQTGVLLNEMDNSDDVPAPDKDVEEDEDQESDDGKPRLRDYQRQLQLLAAQNAQLRAR